MVLCFTPFSLAALNSAAVVCCLCSRSNSFQCRARKAQEPLSPIFALGFPFDFMKEGSRKGFDLGENSEVIEKAFRQLLPEDWLVQNMQAALLQCPQRCNQISTVH